MVNAASKRALIVSALNLEMKEAIIHFVGKLPSDARSGFETVIYDQFGNKWTLCFICTGVGNVAAAAHTLLEAIRFKPDLALFIGIAGGRKDVRIRDVIAVDRIYAYESAEIGQDHESSRPRVVNMDRELVEHARNLSLHSSWYISKEGGQVDGTALPNVFVGPIASGEKLVANNQSPTAEWLNHHYSDTLAIAMEEYGFAYAIGLVPGIRCMVVRGVSDLLSGKDASDAVGSQLIAASNAAAFARHLLLTFFSGNIRKSNDCIWNVHIDREWSTLADPQQFASFLRETTDDIELAIVECRPKSSTIQMRSSRAAYQEAQHRLAQGSLKPWGVEYTVTAIEYVESRNPEFESHPNVTQLMYGEEILKRMLLEGNEDFRHSMILEFLSIPAITSSMHSFIAETATQSGLVTGSPEFNDLLCRSWKLATENLERFAKFPLDGDPIEFRSYLQRYAFDETLSALSTIGKSNRLVQLVLIRASSNAKGAERNFLNAFVATMDIANAASRSGISLEKASDILWQALGKQGG